MMLAFVVGMLGWSLLEYALHRWAHLAKGRNDFSREHLAHHRVEGVFGATWKKLLLAGTFLVGLGGPLALVFPVGVAGGFLLGFFAFYAFYEILHRRLHTHPPTHAYARWARRHHFMHHHRCPKQNLGVTSPLWDLVFGTYRAPVPLRIPRRKACTWMFEARGDEVWAHDFQIV